MDAGVLFKSRLVSQNYGDEEASGRRTKARTVQRFSQRVVSAIAATLPNSQPFIRDIRQAYTQSETTLEL